MIIGKEKIKTIHKIWDNYSSSNKVVADTKGNPIRDINEKRIIAIEDIKAMISGFLKNDLSITEFKTVLDSYNKRNNLWGFAAVKGQMFFNQLVRVSEDKLNKLTKLLQTCISEPKDLNDALKKIELLENYCKPIFDKAQDRRKAPNPSSIGYFLSYFWQIHNYQKWPIMYSSMINAFKELNLWQEHNKQTDTYEYFFSLNEEIQNLLKGNGNSDVSNWEIEHALWEFKGNPNSTAKSKKENIEVKVETDEVIKIEASFDYNEYLIPRVSTLIKLGANSKDTSPKKGYKYEKLVAEVFEQLGFEVDFLGQGRGREPDAILKFREDNTAFLVDAKAYNNGYSLGTDDRAIKEYVNYYLPKLFKQGYKKVGFIIVCNSFKSNFDSFINDITWNTDIKRFMLITSEALLYLLAYKTKDKISLSSIIESIVSMGNLIEAQDIIEKYDDI